MAKREIIIFADDIDGTELPADHKAERFTVDGVVYEIDLSADNAVTLREKLAMLAEAQEKLLGKFIAAGRKVVAPAAGKAAKVAPIKSTVPKVVQKYHRDSIRSWARGYMPTLGDRGRIAAEITDAFENNRDVDALRKYAHSKQMTFNEGGRSGVIPTQAAAPEATFVAPVVEAVPDVVEDQAQEEAPAAKPARAPRKPKAEAKKA